MEIVTVQIHQPIAFLFELDDPRVIISLSIVHETQEPDPVVDLIFLSDIDKDDLFEGDASFDTLGVWDIIFESNVKLKINVVQPDDDGSTTTEIVL